MASFKAKVEARKLLKNLAVGSTPPKAHSTSHRLSGVSRDVHEREEIRRGDDVLRKKYEELGRLLALQHLEQSVVSTIDSMNIQIRSKGNSSKSSKRRKRKSTNSKDKGTKRSTERNSKSKSPGYVFVEIPQAYSERLHEPEDEEHDEKMKLPNDQRRRRPRSARVEPAPNSTISSQRSPCRRTRRKADKSSSFQFKSAKNYKESGSDYFVPYDEYSYQGGDGDGMFHPQESINGRLFDIPEGGDEIVFEEVNEEPLFVIQGEVEITETVSYKVGEEDESKETVNDHVKTDSNDNLSPKLPKRVSFVEDSDEEIKKERSVDDVIFDESRTSADHAKTEDTPLHIVLEEEILNELIHSPRPGLYHKSDSCMDKLQLRTPRKKKKSKTSKSSKNNNKETPKEMKTANSDKKSSNNTIIDAKSPRVTPATPRISDHKLGTTDNPAIKLWLKKKNKLIRQQKREERKKERDKKLAEENELRERMEKMLKSDELVKEWEQRKRKEQKKRAAVEKKVKKAVNKESSKMFEKQAKGEAKVKGEEGRIGERSNSAKVKKTGRAKKKSKVHPGGEDMPQNESRDKKLNLEKNVSYEEWLREKRAHDRKIMLQKQKISHDPELDDIIPSLGRRRIEKATERRGKRLSGEKREREDSVGSDLPESDQGFDNPFKMPNDEDIFKSLGSQSKPRPSSARPQSSSSSRDEPRRLHTSSNSFQNVSQRYAWDGDKISDRGYETLSSDTSYASVGFQSKSDRKNESRKSPAEEEKDEGIFLTEPIP